MENQKQGGEKVTSELLEKFFIIRTSWLFGKNGDNFIKTMLRLAKEKESISVVGDQMGSPTYTVDLASFIYDLVLSDQYGVYHATNEGYCSWAEFAQEIFKQACYKTTVNSITSEEYKSKAKRPKNSKLSKKCIDKIGHMRLPLWQDALYRYLKDINMI